MSAVKSCLTKYTLVVALAFAAFGASALGGVVSSAEANSMYNHNPCGGSFVHSVPVVNNDGGTTKYGDLKLYNEGSGWMCAMTVATGAYAGPSKYMKVRISDGYNAVTEDGSFSYYAGGVRVPANGRKVYVSGTIKSPFSGRLATAWFNL